MSSFRLVPRIFLAAALILGLFVLLVFVTLQNNATRDQEVRALESRLIMERDALETKTVALEATRVYVASDAFAQHYRRHVLREAQEGEVAVVVEWLPPAATPVPAVRPTPDPALYSWPWQMWWSALTDIPAPVAP
jgi:hypothetical protein